MTTSEVEADDLGTEPPGSSRGPKNGDFLLVMLAKLARTHQIEIGVTIMTPGGVVSGTLVSPTRWANGLADWSDDKNMAALLRGIRDGLVESDDEWEEGDPIEYLHLINTRYLAGSELLPGSGSVFWRGRVAEVSAWSFGSFQTS